MADKLKACPFCGQSDFLIKQLDGCSSVVICQGMVDEYSACLARGPVAIQDDDGEEQPGRDAAIRDWNTRDQLPSQGGEAVAWRVTGAGGLTVAAEYPRWAEDDSRLLIEPLYTHPSNPLPGLRLALDLLTEDRQGFMQKRVIVDKLIELGVTLPPEQLL